MKKANLTFGFLSSAVGLGMLIYTLSQQGGLLSIGLVLGMLFLLNGAVRIWAVSQ